MPEEERQPADPEHHQERVKRVDCHREERIHPAGRASPLPAPIRRPHSAASCGAGASPAAMRRDCAGAPKEDGPSSASGAHASPRSLGTEADRLRARRGDARDRGLSRRFVFPVHRVDAPSAPPDAIAHALVARDGVAVHALELVRVSGGHHGDLFAREGERLISEIARLTR